MQELIKNWIGGFVVEYSGVMGEEETGKRRKVDRTKNLYGGCPDRTDRTHVI